LCAAFDEAGKLGSAKSPGVLSVGVFTQFRDGGWSVPGKQHGPSVKKPKTYEALKKKGMSKSRAARISNAQAKKSR
jgi:hypothetical protein